MSSKEIADNRRGPPGFNSKSLSVAHAAADLEVLREIDNIYFSSPSEFDAARHVLENTKHPASCADIEAMFTKLKRQQQVVSGKALHLISQQRDKCDKEFGEIQRIRENIVKTLETCKNARTNLKSASEDLTKSAFSILNNYKKRQIVRTVLKTLELIQRLSNIDKVVSEMVAKKQYEDAIRLIIESKSAANTHKEYSCIRDLAAKLQDTLELTEEKLDSVLSELCYNFDESIFRSLYKAYTLLGKTQSAMEQIHMHYASAVNEYSMEALKVYVKGNRDAKFQDLCQEVPTSKATVCLLDLCENMFQIMKSYYLLTSWHSKYGEERSENAAIEIEKNVSREYIRQKLNAGLIRLWTDVQTRVSTYLKNCGLNEYPFEKFILVLGILRRLTQVAEVFCGDTSEVLQDFIRTQSVTYIKNYHNGRIDELKLFLENESWERCPVKPTFNVLSLQEFKLFKSYLARPKKASEGSTASQEGSAFIKKYFKPKMSMTPFDFFRNADLSNDDIFGVEPEVLDSDSDEDAEDPRQDYLDDSSVTPKNSIIVTNTALSVLRNCGQYLQICRYLPQISLEVVILMYQLYDYYFYTVHLFFTADLEVNSSTLYSTKLNALLKRISNTMGSDTTKSFLYPEQPSLDFKSDEKLHGLSERIVGVESVIFLTRQYEILQPYLVNLVTQQQRVILEHFFDNTLAYAGDLRKPVYMCSASKSFNARTMLIEISQVKWDSKNVAIDNSPYVDKIVRHIQVFAIRLEAVTAKLELTAEVLNEIWAMLAKFIVHLLVEGYSNATKCSNGGRGLMQLDYTQLFVKFEKISNLKPVPYQDYVDVYVKSYYLPRKGLEDFVKDHTEYSNKHLMALVMCACENKRDRQEIASLIERKE